jgi:PTH1 family peptidyl-tRNA hydrolase
MKLIVGLGNPGTDYADTRHNVGWRVAEVLAARWAAGTWKERFDAAVAEARPGGEKVALARPLTWMNRSGLAVRQLMAFWKLAAEDMLVVLDDLALDLGRLRLRASGSAGGHNGLESVIGELGHDGFARLRVGIGPGPGPEDQVDFVLARFGPEEKPLIARAIEEAAAAAECWATQGLSEAMNRFNRPREE